MNENFTPFYSNTPVASPGMWQVAVFVLGKIKELLFTDNKRSVWSAGVGHLILCAACFTSLYNYPMGAVLFVLSV
jgi:hypothetical protein